MKIISLTDENIADEHICCAISDKKCREGYEAKKEWLMRQSDDGFVFKKLDVRGKVFIEYGPAEHAWSPIEAPGYLLINCFWVSGKYKGQGHGKQLYRECLKDAADKNGIVVVTANKKQPFMSDKKFFQKQGFQLADTAEPYFELWAKKLKSTAPAPQIKACAKRGRCDQKNGLTVYYTNGCPFTEYYVNTELVQVAGEKGLPLKIVNINTREQAQHHFVPYTNYTVFYNGKFITQHILNRKNIDRFITADVES
ncbi:MAG: GNAT family N-acetyltransferase [Desulfobacteraceae bacterium]|nr:GNAT family N-acetyltransferase [Desulfobacteraceae bacterium]